mgnify:CR=1 FL=1
MERPRKALVSERVYVHECGTKGCDARATRTVMIGGVGISACDVHVPGTVQFLNDAEAKRVRRMAGM